MEFKKILVFASIVLIISAVGIVALWLYPPEIPTIPPKSNGSIPAIPGWRENVMQWTEEHDLSHPEDLKKFVTIGDPTVRSKTLSVITDAPEGIEVDSQTWKIWKINYWVAHNIKYVSDPKGKEYIAYPNETLECGAGDCDDFAVLTATMYETVGLDATILLVDTDGDEIANHAACSVYYDKKFDEFIKEEEDIMDALHLTLPTGGETLYYNPKLGGTWVLIDPLSAGDAAGYITHEPYIIVYEVNVGD